MLSKIRSSNTLQTSKFKTKDFWINALVYLTMVFSLLIILDYFLPSKEQQEVVVSHDFIRNFGKFGQEHASSLFIETKNQSIQVNVALYRILDKGSDIRLEKSLIFGTVLSITVSNKKYDEMPNMYSGYLFSPILLLISTIINTPSLRRRTYWGFIWFTPVVLIYILGLMIFF